MPPRTLKTKEQSVDPAPQELDFERPFQQLRPETFFRFTREYPKKEAVSIYVYRLLPKINRAQVGITTNYIAIYTEPVSELDLLQKHGSGMYMLKFTDSNQPKSLTQRASCKVELNDPDFPPVVDPRELVLDDEKSRPYLDDLRARGVLKGESVNPASANTDNQAVNALGDIAKKLLEEKGKQGQLGDQLTPIILAILNRNPLDDAMRIATILKPQESKLTEKIVELLMQQKQEQKPADPFETYERIDTILEKMAARAGGGGASKPSGWSEFFQQAPGLLKEGLGLLNAVLAARSGQPLPAQPSATVVPSQAGTPANPEVLPPGDVDMMNPAVIRAMQATGEKAIKAFERGIAGDHFAASMTVDEEGERLYGLLHALGKDGILQAMASVPGLAGRLAPRQAEIEAWLGDFISYGDDDGEGKGQA